jgi:hypothetical protein
MINIINSVLRHFELKVTKCINNNTYPSDFEESDIDLINKVKEFTMTSPERIITLIKAVTYIEKYKIPGDIVECGVWKGGSIMAVIESLKKLNSEYRQVFLYDTFEGMSQPTTLDQDFKGNTASELLNTRIKSEEDMILAYSPLESVKSRVGSLEYPPDKIKFIKGKVEETIPKIMPEKISLLRLDTDWYESTKHELKHLYPLVSKNGVIIIDDYGHWQGCKKAVDEFISESSTPIFLNRIDYTGRIWIKNIE